MRAISRFRSNGLVANSQAFHNARVGAPQRRKIGGTRVYLVNLGSNRALTKRLVSDTRRRSLMSKHALDTTRAENFPAWYRAWYVTQIWPRTSPVRGCMVIKPWGYEIWELLQRQLDDRIKGLGFENCYFPLFVPMSLIAREAEHVEGFVKEIAIVTRHRLRKLGAQLEVDPDAVLDEPLIVRPTSETIIGDSFHRWIQSYGDLP
jgi:prolyl-tRNA synthetase